MTAISDRATVSLCLECASRLFVPTRGEMVESDIEAMMIFADRLLEWHDSRCAERAKRDSVRANAPKITLPNIA